MKKWMVSVIVVALSIGIFGCQAWLMSREGFDTVRAMKEDGGWLLFHTERIPRKEADDLIAADGVLYLHYEDLGYVNAYRTDGTFLRGYQVAIGEKGRGGIGYSNSILYIKGRVSGIYQFRDGELIGFEEQSIHNPDYFACNDIVQTCKPVTDGGYTYYYNAKAGQINRAKPGQALETVVQLPVKDSNVEALIFANLALWVVFASWYMNDGALPDWLQTFHDRKKRLR